MRVGIDSRMISMTGIGTYLRNLIDGIGELDRENEFVLFMDPSDIKNFELPGTNFKIVPSKSTPYSMSEQIISGQAAEDFGQAAGNCRRISGSCRKLAAEASTATPGMR